MDEHLENDNPLPPPTSAAPVFTPSVPPTESAQRPAVATSHQPSVAPGSGPQASHQLTTARYVGDQFTQTKRDRSRSRAYGIAALVFILISAAGYVGFREYIYGDDAPPVIDLDGGE